MLVSANRESAYHDGTLPFSRFRHVNDAQKRTRRMEWAVGRVQQEHGAGKWLTRVSGPPGWQEEGRTPGWNDMVRDERIQKEGRRREQRGKASSG